MDRLGEMQAFVTVVDLGGFTGAADRLGLSKSAVSKYVSSLESRLGGRLLNRTTRRVSPTEIGLLYYDRARQVLADATEADALVTAHQERPQGQLKISAPVSFGTRYLSPLVAEFLCDYPEISIDLSLDDKRVELIDGGFDLAVRIGPMADSALMARKVATTAVLLVASPEYLEEFGEPETIEDLSAHRLLHYSFLSTGNFWRLRAPSGEERQIRFGGQLAANNGDVLLDAATAGLGIIFSPAFFLCGALKEGRLKVVLPKIKQPDLDVHVVYPPGRYVQPKTRAFIDFLVAKFRDVGPVDWPA